MTSLILLRAIANRLTSTSVDDLTCQVGHLATSIANCQDILQSQNLTNDQSIVVHKLKTRTSSLLQDRTLEGRFCGIVVVRALVEAGGLVVLSETGSWIRALISCLNKPDPWEVKRICLTTITRIYVLTTSIQSVVREVTTPTLPVFIAASLSAIKPPTSNQDGTVIRALSPLLPAVLSSWSALIKHFASTFRPYVGSIKSICLSLVSDRSCERHVQKKAIDVLSILHFCAPRNTPAMEWSQMYSQMIEAAHDTSDLVFRAIEVDWTPTIPRITKVTRKQKVASIPTTLTTDVSGLEKWTGVSEGFQRLSAHLTMLQALLTNSHYQEVDLPLGNLLDLTSRLSAVTFPTSKFTLRANAEVAREEREEMWLGLPTIHVAVLKLFTALVLSFGEMLYPICNEMVSQLWEIFESSCANQDVRSAAYELLRALLDAHLALINKSDSSAVKRLVAYCCADIMSYSLREKLGNSHLTNGKVNAKTLNIADALIMNGTTSENATDNAPALSHEIYVTAHDLLPTLFTYAPLNLLEGGSAIRAQLDSTSILLEHRDGILASVLKPYQPPLNAKSNRSAQPNPSILPFLARSCSSEGTTRLEYLSIEGLLRPRMPMVISSSDVPIDIISRDMELDYETAANNHTFSDIEKNGMEEEQLGPAEIQTRLQAEVVGSPNDMMSEHPSQTPSEAQKRDFTALLERSADEQLAASAMESYPKESDSLTNLATPEAVIAKRQRVASEDSSSMTQDDTTSAKLGKWSQATEAIAKAETNASMENHAPASTSILDSFTTDVVKGSGTNDNESDHSSDSEIPLIDATLVGMSDSEDDEN